MDLLTSGGDLVKHIHVGGDMKKSWIMFDHVKQLKDWTMVACHVYDSKYYKALTIVCCDMQFENGMAHKLGWENLNVVMAESGVPIVNFKGVMANNAHAN